LRTAEDREGRGNFVQRGSKSPWCSGAAEGKSGVHPRGEEGGNFDLTLEERGHNGPDGPAREGRKVDFLCRKERQR